MKEKKFALYILLAITILISSIIPIAADPIIPDVDVAADYAEAVGFVKEAGIMVGDEQGNFNPNKIVTRAQMATIICNMLGEASNATPAGGLFTDVPKTHWASGYIEKAVSLNMISGYGDSRFGPDDNVTYEQAITMLVRTLDYESEAAVAGGYPDGYMSIAQELGLLDGVNLSRGAALDRANVAIMIYNCYHSYA